GSSIDYIVQPVKHKKYPPLRRIFVICVYFDFFLYRRLLYFSSNSLPSSSLSIVNGCLQCMHASTRPNILVGFSQLGQIIGTARVHHIPIHKSLNLIRFTRKIAKQNNEQKKRNNK